MTLESTRWLNDLLKRDRRYKPHAYTFVFEALHYAQTVLNSWGIYATADFGEIVFNLIEIGKMRKTADDCREDFENVYDFDEAFERGFKITLPD